LKKSTDADLIAAYRDLGSIWLVAERFGMCGQSVHERLRRLGMDMSQNVFSDEEREILKKEYQRHRDHGRLDLLAERLGRTKAFICRQARALGLTDQGAQKRYSRWKYMTEAEATKLMDEFRTSTLTLDRWCKWKGIPKSGFTNTMRRFFADEWEAVIESKTPRTSLYRLGRQFEYRCRDKLRDAGFFVVRSPQSRSPVDLVAIKSGTVLFVQCKAHGYLGVSEWNELYDLATSTGALPILATREGARKTAFYRMDDRKGGRKTAQPRTEVTLHELEQDGVA